MNELKTTLTKLEDTLDLYLVKKAPAIPTNIKELLVSIIPWLTLIMAIVVIPGLLALLGLGAVLAPFGMMAGVPTGAAIISLLFALIVVILEVMAIPGLLKRTRAGWNLLYYASILTLIQNIIFFSIGGILGVIISFYLLFQIKEYYKN